MSTNKELEQKVSSLENKVGQLATTNSQVLDDIAALKAIILNWCRTLVYGSRWSTRNCFENKKESKIKQFINTIKMFLLIK